MEYIETPREFSKRLFDLKQDKEYKFTFTENRMKRSLNANSYYWATLQELAEKLGLPKEEVYRKHIKEVGAYTPLCVQNKALEEFLSKWSSKGIGWICEVDKSKIDDCTTVFAYYGSSTYDSKQMSRLIDQLVQDCHNVGVMTLQDKELEKMIDDWGR